ncbi:MAG: DNA polymerase/3'-5' exonuclease PolX [Patescibacteria group bacterium]|nr:DNA polymerase/3'-5' exonuclease PolX [Patescibacteria group bacterium]MCL5262138.1 DNA polymerase/3'-5' exonuclease PolX [Patescibacteria group bacterium]
MNEEIARIFNEISEYLEMQGVAFKPQAYSRAASVIDSLEEDISSIYKKGGTKALEDIPGVGASMAEKMEEYLKTGKIKYYESLKKKTPVDLSGLSQIEGLGPQKIKVLYKKLGIQNVDDLEKAAETGKISKLAGFGKKSEENILKGIVFTKKFRGRYILGNELQWIESVAADLKRLKEVKRLDVAGSTRRRKETIGDLDILAISSNPKPVMDYFVSRPWVIRVYGKGEGKSSIKAENGMDMDLRVLPEKSYGAGLLYFTGSKEHNIRLRELAIKKGLKLNEYGLFRGSKMIAGKTEEEIYGALGLEYVPPEMREDTGELAAAINHRVPKLIDYGSVRGDLQIQTDWSDGENSIEEYVEAARKSGLKYIAVTDHTKSLKIANGLDEKRLVKQMASIDRLNDELKKKKIDFRILKGAEVDILKDGSLDLPDKMLAKLDIVGIAIHSFFSLSEKEQTKRLIRAMENKYSDIVFHPTGRVIGHREPLHLDMAAVIKAAKATGTVLEIDSYPNRLDLKDEYVKQAVAAGVKLSVDSDSHSVSHLRYLDLGVAQARRGWTKKSDVVNAWPLEKALGFLKK